MNKDLGKMKEVQLNIFDVLEKILDKQDALLKSIDENYIAEKYDENDHDLNFRNYIQQSRTESDDKGDK